MRVLAFSKQTVRDSQDGEATDEFETYSMERNKNRLELKTARDGPVLTNCSHVLEAVMLKAAKERVRMLSRTRTTGISQSVNQPGWGERGGLLKAMNLINRKGRLIDFGTVVVFMTGRVAGVRRADSRERNGSLAGQRASTGGKRGKCQTPALF